MKDSEIQEELLQSYIETETVSSARPLRPNDVQLSQLIREYYNNKKDLHKEAAEKNSNVYSDGYDALTGLINPPHMVELLEKYLQLAKERDKVLGILYLELHGLKQIASIYGNTIADEVLIIFAKRLKLLVSQSDLLSYFYGNNFLIGLITEKTDLEIVENLSEKIMMVIAKPMNVGGYRLQINASVSSVAYPFHGDKVGVLLDIAKMKVSNRSS